MNDFWIYGFISLIRETIRIKPSYWYRGFGSKREKDPDGSKIGEHLIKYNREYICIEI